MCKTRKQLFWILLNPARTEQRIRIINAPLQRRVRGKGVTSVTCKTTNKFQQFSTVKKKTRLRRWYRHHRQEPENRPKRFSSIGEKSKQSRTENKRTPDEVRVCCWERYDASFKVVKKILDLESFGTKNNDDSLKIQRKIQTANRCFFGLHLHKQLQSRHLSRHVQWDMFVDQRRSLVKFS
jgi:hypothetical protein